MEPIILNDMEEYQYVIDRGYSPLLDYKRFTLPIALRVEIQRGIFGKCIFGRGDVQKANERFFRWIWDHKSHYCEECMKPLYDYSAVYCSHILTRGAFPEMAHDPRNINLLCFAHHNQWENGNRQAMRIYPANIKVIELMKKEYQQLQI